VSSNQLGEQSDSRKNAKGAKGKLEIRNNFKRSKIKALQRFGLARKEI